ncbi:receptor-like protein kinase HSL1 [Selaginella moellendorffii]|nr:receptor-like protein kinase HSL1 [Selaginella moellendorffii]|eukprot:XP_002962286.2 receptor-like protein kinase HSL1 [Selaginella moellendorffii]
MSAADRVLARGSRRSGARMSCQILAAVLGSCFAIFAVVLGDGSDQVVAMLALKSGIVDRYDRLASWKSSDKSPCGWEGVECVTGIVVGINIGSRNLSGSIDGLFDCSGLSNLSSFAAYDNSFSGGFPAWILSCKNLVSLELQRNPSMGGALPANLSALSLLQHLDLSFDPFTGTIPEELGGLKNLQRLLLWSCKLEGPLPSSIGELSSLTNLTLSYNNLGPELPESLRNLSTLQSLKCGGCGLSGRIPSWLGDLRKLDFLELTYNSLSGDIPVAILGLPKLTKLELYNNLLTGGIPREIAGLTSLTDLDLSSNSLSGSIPEEIASIRGLALIHLWNNSLTGAVPRGIANLTALYDVGLFQNRLTGKLPPDMGSLSSLQIFDVSSNNLSGEIPRNLCRGGRLWRLMLFQNSFSGGIPPELGSCESLIRVRIFGNSLSGAVPPGLWGKPLMVILDISDNQLEGAIDPAIAKSERLEMLRIFGNQLGGELPRSMGRLRSLNQLNASGNQLTGSIPSEIAQCLSLTYLFLDGNKLQGPIPGEIGELKRLQYLSLARNSLSGSIPGEVGELSNLISLDLSENQLSGRIPPELGKLRLAEFTHFNVSYNRLTGSVPFDVNSAVFGSSFIGNPGLCVTTSGSPCSASSGMEADQTQRSKRSPGVMALIAGVVLASAAVVSLAASCWFYRKYKALVHREEQDQRFGGRGEALEWSLTPFQKLDFSQEDVLASLDEDNVIGCGGAGKVYKASLKNGQCLAVKKLWSSSGGKDTTSSSGWDYGFQAEIESLGRIRHVNIVRLLCCCSNGETNVLVYDYMPNGSLGDLLHSKKGGVLDWSARYRAALGAAHGLAYLHHDCVPQILHRDVKSNNILLSEDFDGLLADFGLARLLEGSSSGENGGGYSVSSLPGSLGYIAPEYAHKLKVNEKSDIYSYGVVLLELLTGRRPVDAGFGDDGMDIVRWVCAKIQSRDDVIKVFDPRIVGASPRDMMLVLKIALHCTSEVPANRPSMREVVRMLKDVDPSLSSAGDSDDQIDRKKSLIDVV